jgi:hypothetical protein
MPVNNKIAQYLGDQMGANKVASLVYRKKGTLMGRGADRKKYGDDLVSTVVVTGFDYHRVVSKSQEMLTRISAQDILALATDQELRDKDNEPLTFLDVNKALQELWESFERTLKGESKAPKGVYTPLTVDGVNVPGCRVYQGDSDGTEQGTIYLQGLKIGEKILEPSPNGSAPTPRSGKIPLAKRLIREQLPVGQYVSYSLEPHSGFDLRIGVSAGISADEKGILIRDEDLQYLKDCL